MLMLIDWLSSFFPSSPCVLAHVCVCVCVFGGGGGLYKGWNMLAAHASPTLSITAGHSVILPLEFVFLAGWHLQQSPGSNIFICN